MTCERCKEIPDETITHWAKQKRIAELKAELLDLEGPKPQPNYTITSTNL